MASSAIAAPVAALEVYAASSEIRTDTFNYVSDEKLNNTFRRAGYAEHEFAGLRKSIDDNIKKAIRGGARVKIKGVSLPLFYSIRGVLMPCLPLGQFKPKSGAADVYTYQIPGSPLSIRIWDGGMESDGQYMLDFFDRATKKAVNSPKDFQIVPITRPGIFDLGPLVSWEVAMGRPRDGIPDGEERFSVIEGSCWTLKWPGGDFSFVVPVRTDSMDSLATAVPYVS